MRRCVEAVPAAIDANESQIAGMKVVEVQWEARRSGMHADHHHPAAVCGRPEAIGQRGRMAGAIEGNFDAGTPGSRCHRGLDLPVTRVNDLVRAQPQRQRPPVGVRLGYDDPRRPAAVGELQGQQPHRPGAGEQGSSTHRQLGALDGSDNARQRLDKRAVLHGHTGGQRKEPVYRGHDLLPIAPARQTGDRRPDLNPGHVIAHCDDLAAKLMSHHAGNVHPGKQAVNGMHLGLTDAAGPDLHTDLARSRLRHRRGADLEPSPGNPRCLSHGSPPFPRPAPLWSPRFAGGRGFPRARE